MYNAQETADRIKKLLIDRGTTGKIMCQECGLGVNGISNIRKGDIKNIETFNRIADFFNVPVDYLLGRTDDPNQKPGERNIKLDEFSYAMYNESKELSDSDKQRLLTFARMLRESSEEANDN